MFIIFKFYLRDRAHVQSHSLLYSPHAASSLGPRVDTWNLIQVSYVSGKDNILLEPFLLPPKICSGRKLEYGSRAWNLTLAF